MAKEFNRKPVWGWMLFDFASQPFHTLLITFIFAPYFTSSVMSDSVEGQSVWAFTTAATGLAIAVMAPILGALADSSGPRKPWILLFSVFYVVGAAGLWFATPGMDDVTFILIAFALGLIGVEFAFTFTNAFLPDIVPRKDVGAVSGTGWALGYVGGLLVLFFVLLLLAENDEGKTFIGLPPIGGLDPEMREGTRSVGPITAVWYIIFMIPFFLWVPDAPRKTKVAGAVRKGLVELWQTIRNLPKNSSLTNFLLASMFYRDALNAIYAFGGIYAAGVLGWSIVQIGIFGIIAAATGAVGAWVGGRADRTFGPNPVVLTTIIILILVCVIAIGTSRDAVFGMAVDSTSSLPDIVFYICGAMIGAAGGSLQAASRTLLVHQGDPERMTEAFGLYALVGKSTAFLAPLAIGIVTVSTGSQHYGIFIPVIVLFVIGLVLLQFVKTPKLMEGADA